VRRLRGDIPPEVDAITGLGLTMPDIGHLRAVDNLHLQAAVARIKA
jgi:hypothetical protein